MWNPSDYGLRRWVAAVSPSLIACGAQTGRTSATCPSPSAIRFHVWWGT